MKRPLFDAAKATALAFAIDPFGWFCVLLVFGKSWKAGLIVLAIILSAMALGFFIVWERNRDTQAPDDRDDIAV
jgi:fatty acid desaturase